MVVSLHKKLKTRTLHPHLPHLPYDIIYSGILTRLPVKSLFRFRCVSKLWNAAITDPDFIKSHSLCAQQNSTSSILGLYRIQTKDKKNWAYKFFTKDVPKFFRFRVTKATKLIGQCNGLFCFRSRRHFMICNPCTREFLWYRLPPRPPRHHPVSYGFGFDSLTHEYKLVQIVHANRNFYRCMVYTMGAKTNNSWREIAVSVNLSQHFSWRRISEDSDIGGTVNSGRAVFINGTLFWFFRQPHLLMSFDLHFEKFDFVQGPIAQFRLSYFFWKPDCLCFLMELQGCLCLAFQYDYDGDTVQLYRYSWLRANDWDVMLLNLQYKPILQVGALGPESLLYSLTSKDVMVYTLGGLNGCEHHLVGSKHEKFPSLQGVDHSIVSECGFSYHVENLDSLKSLLGSSPAQPRYVKDRK